MATAAELAQQIAAAAVEAAGGRDTTVQSNIRSVDARSLETKSGSGNR